MSMLTGYFLGQMAGSQQEWLNKWRAHVNRRSNGEMSYEEAVDELLRQRDKLTETVTGLRQEVLKLSIDATTQKTRIADLEATIARRDVKLAEWEQYADEKEADHSRLRAWSNDAEARLQRYHALYGPLPADKTAGK